MPESPSFGSHDSSLHALGEALDALDRGNLGVRPRDIACVEAFWSYEEWDVASGGFVLRLHDGRRAYLDVWVEGAEDDSRPPCKVDVELQELPAGQKYPHFPSTADPIGGWRDDVEPLNALLRRTCQG